MLKKIGVGEYGVEKDIWKGKKWQETGYSYILRNFVISGTHDMIHGHQMVQYEMTRMVENMLAGFDGETCAKELLGRSRRRWEDKITRYPQGMSWKAWAGFF